jgi:hypothetical protein
MVEQPSAGLVIVRLAAGSMVPCMVRPGDNEAGQADIQEEATGVGSPSPAVMVEDWPLGV